MAEQVKQERLTMDVSEVADALGISKILAYDLVRQGKIPSIRISSRRILCPKAAIAKLLDLTTK
jgi:excisionase family DNA binding protein